MKPSGEKLNIFGSNACLLGLLISMILGSHYVDQVLCIPNNDSMLVSNFSQELGFDNRTPHGHDSSHVGSHEESCIDIPIHGGTFLIPKGSSPSLSAEYDSQKSIFVDVTNVKNSFIKSDLSSRILLRSSLVSSSDISKHLLTQNIETIVLLI